MEILATPISRKWLGALRAVAGIAMSLIRVILVPGFDHILEAESDVLAVGVPAQNDSLRAQDLESTKFKLIKI